ncbi:MAG TPA: helix-turn-helix transcriptional regulator [Clostridiaceae bacterium]|nr:helix-turn-helix transcriptional regulator [Clostridiaceae bacterium]
MDTRLIFGRRLKEARNDSGITLKELANKVKLSESTVSRYEKGIIEAKHPLVKIPATKKDPPEWVNLPPLFR